MVYTKVYPMVYTMVYPMVYPMVYTMVYTMVASYFTKAIRPGAKVTKCSLFFENMSNKSIYFTVFCIFTLNFDGIMLRNLSRMKDLDLSFLVN